MDTEQLLDAAIRAARASPNRVRKVGAVLVLADGTTTLSHCNSVVRGVADLEQRHAGDGRLVWMEHAERNAIFAAARSGMATEGATLASSYFPAWTARAQLRNPASATCIRCRPTCPIRSGVRPSYLRR